MSAVDPDLDFIRVGMKRRFSCLSGRVGRLRGVKETHADAVVVLMDAGWSDVGSWSSLWGDQCPHRRGQRLPWR